MSDITWQQFDRDVDEALRLSTAFEQYSDMLRDGSVSGDIAKAICIGLGTGHKYLTGYGLEDADQKMLGHDGMKSGKAKLVETIRKMLAWLKEQYAKAKELMRKLRVKVAANVERVKEAIKDRQMPGGVKLDIDAGFLTIGGKFVGNDPSHLREFAEFIKFTDKDLPVGYLKVQSWVAENKEKLDNDPENAMALISEQFGKLVPMGKMFTRSIGDGRVATKEMFGDSVYSMPIPNQVKATDLSGFKESIKTGFDGNSERGDTEVLSASRQQAQEIVKILEEIVVGDTDSNPMSAVERHEEVFARISGATDSTNSLGSALALSKAIATIYDQVSTYKLNVVRTLNAYVMASVEAAK